MCNNEYSNALITKSLFKVPPGADSASEGASGFDPEPDARRRDGEGRSPHIPRLARRVRYRMARAAPPQDQAS